MIEPAAPSPVHVRHEGHVAVVSFARPPHNLADLALIREIGRAFDDGQAVDIDR